MAYEEKDLIDVLKVLQTQIDNIFEKAYIDNLLQQEDEHGYIALTDKQKSVITDMQERYMR